ncbi:MAG: AzlD domain-containing protein [Lentisphaeria bacterium]|nr:AzlD domain-containing protein [Lentisphaeria bacterium]
MIWYLFRLVLITGAVTFLLRAFPFLAFGRGNKPPEIIRYLGDVVSPAAIAMLVVYCYFAYFKARPFSAASGWNLPEVAAGLLVIWLHLWKRNALLSIIAGVILYMFLVQKIFS